MSWAQAIHPYTKSAGVFQCPSNPIARTAHVNSDTTGNPGVPDTIPASYAYAYQLFRTELGGPRTIAFINEPASKILLAEQSRATEAGLGWTDWTGNQWADNGFAAHTGRWNCLFADGHVKAMKPTATGAPVNMWGAFTDSTAANPNCVDYNCDDVSPALQGALAQLDAKYK